MTAGDLAGIITGMCLFFGAALAPLFERRK